MSFAQLWRMFPQFPEEELENKIKKVRKENPNSSVKQIIKVLIKNINSVDVGLPLIVSGVNEVYYMRNKEKLIYCFGEYHTDEYCKSSDIFVVTLFERILLSNPDKKINLFLEISQTEYSKDLIQSPIQLSSKSFQGCLKNSKDECHYPNLRTHFIDIRKEIINVFIALEKYLYDASNKNKDEFNKLEGSLSFDKSIITRKINSLDEDAREVLSEFAEESFTGLIKSFQNIRKWINVDPNTEEEQDDKFLLLRGLRKEALDHSAGLMDVYTLSKIFRTNSNYIIVFTGSYHSRNYIDILQRLSYEKVNWVVGNEMCSDLLSFVPFFG